ncbi:MAG: hypothetical protein QOJ92_1565 [Frankiales bacterium]|nr:hypothetical protein [Frankiales bacterium]
MRPGPLLIVRTLMRSLAVLPLLALVSACAVGGGDEPSTTPRRDLAGRPSPLPTDLAPLPGASGGPTAEPTAGVSAPGGPGSADPRPGQSSSPQPGSSGGGPGPAAPYRAVTTTSDLQHDNDPSSPAYADLLSVGIEDDGTHARVTVTVRGTLPARAAADEVMGIGVDLYRQGNVGRESDYQLFADGEPSGWYAYLQTPKGFVRYPGQFALGGGRLVFTVPWSAIGSPHSGRFSGYVDWTRSSSAVTGNDASNDYAPTVGTSAYSR